MRRNRRYHLKDGGEPVAIARLRKGENLAALVAPVGKLISTSASFNVCILRNGLGYFQTA
jgi:hypothetical protein